MQKANDYSMKPYFNFSPEQCSELSMYEMLEEGRNQYFSCFVLLHKLNAS